ncbi:hypothetical protein EIN_382770, partial [Entamoeba invadens IP1]
FISELFSLHVAGGDDFRASAGGAKKGQRGAKFLTVESNHRKQLDDLMKKLRMATPHFIRYAFFQMDRREDTTSSTRLS